MTYRASVSTGSLNRQELVATLEEWPEVHRSILLQGGRLSVDDTCPVIIQSLDEEECEGPSQAEMVSGQPEMVTGRPGMVAEMVALSTFLATVISVTVVLGSITVLMTTLLICTCAFRNKRV